MNTINPRWPRSWCIFIPIWIQFENVWTSPKTYVLKNRVVAKFIFLISDLDRKVTGSKIWLQIQERFGPIVQTQGQTRSGPIFALKVHFSWGGNKRLSSLPVTSVGVTLSAGCPRLCKHDDYRFVSKCIKKWALFWCFIHGVIARNPSI